MKGKSTRVAFSNLSKAGILLFIVLFGGFVHKENTSEGLKELKGLKDFQQSAVLLNNQSDIVPFKDLAARRIASVNTGFQNAAAFDNMLRKYADVSSFNPSSLKNSGNFSGFTTLIIQVTDQSVLDPATVNFILDAQKTKEVIVAGFGNTTALQRLDPVSAPLVWNPAKSVSSAERSAEIIFGGESAEGKLQQNVSTKYPLGAGFSTVKTRLRYSSPEELGISSAKLDRIDDIMYQAINEHATPGAVVMVVKDGNVIFNKAYGSHTYGSDDKTRVDDIFDLASVTKIASTTIAAMKLYDENKLDLNKGIGSYLPDVRSTNKNGIPVRDVMLHQAGFVNLDFLSYVKSQDHSSDSSFFYPVKITDHYFLRRDFYKDVMWRKMLNTPLPTRGEYVYSDISMFMMKEIIEHQAGEPLDQFVENEFYTRLGMRTAGYNPLKRFHKEQIVPTERDTYFRRTLLQGIVHDSGASLAGGVSGHAGLFASANDLAILNQMLLNGGSYGGVEYLKPETVSLFTSKQSDVSRRGLGFDRSNGSGYPSRSASMQTFGHTGYTGTCVWVDPKYNLVYIFLSNRVYPSASTRLNSLSIRPRIQEVIYSAIQDSNRNLVASKESR